MLDNDDRYDPPTLQNSNSPASPLTRLLLGIGNDLHGDDGAGPLLAQRFQSPGWISVDAGTAPENFTSLIRRHHPRHLVIVDAAELGLAAGEFRRVPPEKIQNVGMGTHQMPLYHLIHFLADAADNIDFIGIQPATLLEEPGLSPAVESAIERIAALLRHDRVESIPSL